MYSASWKKSFRDRRLLELALIWLCCLCGPYCSAADATTLPPRLRITPGSAGDYQLTITNAVAGHAYELLLASPGLGAGWALFSFGMVGQTNFVIAAGETGAAFFQARAQDDWDHDGVANWQDARPLDAAVGRLRVTIDTPQHGQFIQ